MHSTASSSSSLVVSVKQTVARQPTIQSAFSAATPYNKRSTRYKNITRAVTYCLAKDMMPMRTVGKKGLPEVNDPQLYAEHRRKLEEELKSVRHFAVTTDLWSRLTSEPYMSLTVHYVDRF